MLGLGETLARRRGLLRAMNKSLRGLDRDNRVDVLTKQQPGKEGTQGPDACPHGSRGEDRQSQEACA